MSRLFNVYTDFADWLVYTVLGIAPETGLGHFLHFVVEDLSKIIVLAAFLIYVISFLRVGMDLERVKSRLAGKSRWTGYFLAALFGAVTPFCSCSSIPMFLAFTAGGIPIGFTMAFLITSPIINEVAVVLLGTELGWRFTLLYITTGLGAGVIGGWFFDKIKAERFLKGLGAQAGSCCAPKQTACCGSDVVAEKQFSRSNRHQFAKEETRTIMGRIWLWIVIGVLVGGIFHGYVPEAWVQEHLAGASIWSVPVAAVLGLPMYANATGVVPVAASMLEKGIPLGTVLTFMMSVVGASLPEFMMLKQVMKPKLLLCFFCLLLILFTICGWVFNALQPWIL